MKNQRIDEASVTSMINGFLAGRKKKINEQKNKAVSKKKDAFWKSITESVILEIGSEDPDDWRQDFDVSAGEGPADRMSLKNIGEDPGVFSAEAPGVVPGESNFEEISGQDASKLHGRQEFSVRDIQKMIAARLKDIEKTNPKLWEKYNSLDDNQKKVFRHKLGKEELGKVGGKKAREAKEGTARSNPEKRKEITANIVPKVLDAMVSYVKRGEPIPKNISTFSTKYLGFEPTTQFNRAKLEKFAQLDKIPQEIYDIFTTKALENKKEGSIIPFAATNLDMYPQDWQDEIEQIANQKGLPGGSNRERGIGGGVRTLGSSPKTPEKLKQRPTQQMIDKDENLKNAIVGRKFAGNTPLYRTFKDFDIDKIMKYHDYFEQNPDEITRARAERKAPSPIGKGSSFATGNPESIPKSQMIGSTSEKSILSPDEIKQAKSKYKPGTEFKPSLNLDPKDVLNRVSDFGEPTAPDPAENSIFGKLAQGFANILSNKNPKLEELKSNYLRAAEEAKPLMVKNAQGQLSPQEMSNFQGLMLQLKTLRQQMEQVKQSVRVQPGEVVDLLRKMAIRDKRGQFKGLQDPTKMQFDDPEDFEMAKVVYSKLDPSRLNVKTGDKEKMSQYSLKKFLPGFAASEEEKTAANIPALKNVQKQQAADAEKAAEAKARDEREEKARVSRSKLSLADIQAAKQKERDTFGKTSRAMLKRRTELDKDETELDKDLPKASFSSGKGVKDLLKTSNKFLPSLSQMYKGAGEKHAFPTVKDEPQVGTPKPKAPAKPPELASGKVSFSRRPHNVAGLKQKMSKVVEYDPSFSYDREDPSVSFKANVQKLIQDAKKKLAVTGDEVSNKRVIQHIADNFTRGPNGTSGYPKEFDSLKDFFLNKAKEGKDLNESRSIKEYLMMPDSNKESHAEVKKKEGWDKASLAKKLNMVPKFKKSKSSVGSKK